VGKPKAPKTPDYAAAAKAQGDANLGSALATNYLNQPNQVGPDGSLTFSYDYAGGNRLPDGTVIPRTTATTTLSPDQQRLYDQNNQISIALNDLAKRGIGYVDTASATPTNINGAPQLSGAPGATQFQSQYDLSHLGAMPSSSDFGAQRDQVTEALMARMQPYIDRDRAALDNKLANQGLNIGSQARNWDEDTFNRGVNDQRLAAVLGGSQEQQRLFDNAMGIRSQGFGEAVQQGDFANKAAEATFGQGLASSQMNNQARQQALQEADYFKNQPLNMLNALRTGNQVSMPQFGDVSTGAQVQAAPIYAATNDQYNAELQRYQQKMAGFSSLMGGLGSLGSAAVFASDRRLKENIRKIGETASGLGIYFFNYIGQAGESVGYMADEVIKLFPAAVILDPSGFYKVNYGLVK